MQTELLAVLDGSHIVVAVIAAAVSVVVSYLFLRANPNKKAAVDAWVNDQSKNHKDQGK